MAEYGITIGQAGTRIDTASDYQRILDTRWKTLSIVATIPVSRSDILTTPTITKLYEHNLGYLPAFEAPFLNTRYEVQSTADGSFAFVSDREAIYLVTAGSPPASNPYSVNGYINLYDLNMEEDFDSPPKGIISPSTDSSIGIKIKGNDDYAARFMDDTDPLGFSVSTDSKAFGISKVNGFTLSGANPSLGTEATATITHELGYPPLIKIADLNPLATLTKPSAGPFIGPMSIGSFNAYVVASTNQLTIYGSKNGSYRYVVFRDPSEIAM